MNAERETSIIGQRYHVAWLELSNRVGQRQQIQQVYLVVCAAIFGAFFGVSDAVQTRIAPFLLISISALTVFSCISVYFHNLGIQNLIGLLAQTEANLASSIASRKLFYFWDGVRGIDLRHAELRRWSRISSLYLFVFTVTGSHVVHLTVVPSEARNYHVAYLAGFFSFVAFALVILGWSKDRKLYRVAEIIPESQGGQDAGDELPARRRAKD